MCLSGTKAEIHFGTRRAALVMVVVVLVGGYFQSCVAQQKQRTFSSAEEAARALFTAVQSHNDREIMNILGAGSELVSTGDDVQDKLESEQFARKYQEMHRLVREPDKTTVLYVGAENWPFPIPLVSRQGVWRFDAQAGSDEILCRRIGNRRHSAGAGERGHWRRDGGGQIRSSFPRLLLSNPNCARGTRVWRNEKLHLQRQDDRRIRFRSLPSGVPLLRRENLHCRPGWNCVRKRSWQGNSKDRTIHDPVRPCSKLAGGQPINWKLRLNRIVIRRHL